MSILNQHNQIAQSVVANGLTTGNQVQNPNNLLNTTDSTALFGATSDVIIGNFPFNIPLDAVIVGISGILKARIDNNSIPSGSIIPVLVDSTSGTNAYFPGAAVTGLSDVLQEYEIGGAYDIWGNVSWTPAKINNLRLQLIANSSLEVAWASMTVFYYIPQVTPTPPAFQLPGCEDCDSTIQALPFELAQPWLANQDTLVLRSFNLPDGTPITLSMLGECGGTINVTVDPDLRKEDGDNFIENFNIDASIASITNLPNGTVSIDLGNINRRGLGFSTPYGHDSANISEHAAGAVVIITNNGPWNSKLLKKCHIGTLVSAPITVEDEGDTVVVATETFNFIGPNVQAEQDSIDERKANITVISNPTNVEPTEEDTNTGTNNTTPSTTLTVPLTIVDANYLRVAVITEDEVISGVTYNGVAMSLIDSQVNPGVNLKVALYELINPAVGAHNAVVTMATSRIITAIVTSWLDVDTTNPVDGVSAGAIGSNNAPSDSATTTTENTVMQDVVGTTNNPTTFSQSGLWSIQGAVTTGIRPGASSSRRVLAPQTVSDTYGLSLSTGWAMLVAGIRGISSPTPGSGIQSVTGEGINNDDPLNPVLANNMNATTAPGASNDNTEGYVQGSLWFNTISNTLYVALSVGTGAAVWDAVSPGGGAGYDTIQSVGTPVAQEDTINFSTLFTVTDDPGVATDVDIDVVDLANDNTFITTLTNNATFQTNVNNFVTVSGAGNLAEQFDDFISANAISEGGTGTDGHTAIGNFSFAKGSGASQFINSENNHTGIIKVGSSGLFGFASISETGTVLSNLLYAGNDFKVRTLSRLIYDISSDTSLKYTLSGASSGNDIGIKIVFVAGVPTVNYFIGGTDTPTGVTLPVSGDWFEVEMQLIGTTLTMKLDNQVVYTGTLSSTTNFRLTYDIVDGTEVDFDIDWVRTVYRQIDTGSDSEKKVGVGSTTDINWFNTQIPFSFANGTNPRVDIWEIATQTYVSPTFADFGGENYVQTDGGSITSFLPDFTGGVSTGGYKFNSTKQAIFSCMVYTAEVDITPGNNNDGGIGFTPLASGFAGRDIINAQGTNDVSVGFVRDIAGQWYARCADGAGFTETPVSISDLNTHVFRVEYDPGNATPQARFYVDGILLATITTDVPSSVATIVGWAAGQDVPNSLAMTLVSCPSFAVEI